MRTDLKTFCTTANHSIRDILGQIDANGLGILLIVSEDGILQGVVTDGDIRRALQENVSPESESRVLLERKANTAYARPISGRSSDGHQDHLETLRKRRILHLPIVGEDMRVVGLVTRDIIPLSEPEITGNEWKYVKECLDSGWVSSAGPFVSRFESAFAAYAGARNAVAVGSGTAGLHVALRVVGVEAGDEVIVSDLTFIASVNAINYCGAHPILMDASPRDWQMDAEKVARFLESECSRRSGHCINKRTGRRVRAIVPVHILGLACDIQRIIELASSYGLAVIEDAAEGVGVLRGGKHVGTFGDIGVFSFNGNKIVTTGGGGMLVTQNDRHAEYARYLTTQAKDDPLEYVHNEIGYNYRMTNIQAAMGVAQLERLSEFIARKRAIARAYEAAFTNDESLTRMPVPEDVTATYWLYTVLLSPETTLERRKEILKKLNANGIGARPFWHPVHDLPPYRTCQSYEIEHAVRLYERGISLPSSVGLPKDDLERCIHVFMQLVQADVVLR